MSTTAPQHAPSDVGRALKGTRARRQVPEGFPRPDIWSPEQQPDSSIRSLEQQPGSDLRSPEQQPDSESAETQGHPPEPDRIDALLRELRVQGVDAVNRAPALPGLQQSEEWNEEGFDGPHPSHCATGLEDLDRLLCGGFPRKGLSEIAGPISSGRTSLALAALAHATSAGEWAGWIEIGDAFDPPSAVAAGVVLERVLWVRAPDASKALAAAEQLLSAGGFGPLLLDLSPNPTAKRPPREVATSAWPRLRRRSAESESALVVLNEVRSVGSFADLAFELRHARPHFEGDPALFTGLSGEIRIVRQRSGGGMREIAWASDDGRLKTRAA